jgi:hypothetical protein
MGREELGHEPRKLLRSDLFIMVTMNSKFNSAEPRADHPFRLSWVHAGRIVMPGAMFAGSDIIRTGIGALVPVVSADLGRWKCTDDSLQSTRSHSPDVASRSEREAPFSDPLGRGQCTRPRPDHRHRLASAGPQRHRYSWGVVLGLPGARGLGRGA